MTLKIAFFFILTLVFVCRIECQMSSVQVERIEMNPVEPKPGESVKIRCYLKNVDPTKSIKPDIIWSFREIDSDLYRIVGNGATTTDTFNNRLSGRKESDEVYEIVFRPIQETDAGFIKCELTDSEGQIFKVQPLNIYSPPYISYITPDVYTTVGSKVVLECNADGYPKPTIQWSRLGELSAVLYGSKYVITSVGREDRGIYKCYVENSTPNKNKQTVEAYVTVTIDFPPTIDCSTQTMYQIASINADAEVTCTIEGYPLNNVKWYFTQPDLNIETVIETDEHHKIESIISSPDTIKSTLIVRDVNKENFGLYTIKVEGGSQQIEQKTVSLEELYTPEKYTMSSNSNKISNNVSSFILNLLLSLIAFL